MFGTTISLQTLAYLCRSMATLLESGIPIVKVVSSVSKRIGGPGCQRRMRDVAGRLMEGEDIRSAFDAQRGYFPDLFVDMVAVAEDTGSLPEVLKSLADHYENMVRLKREFVGQIALPVVQLVAAIFIVGFVIFVMGLIAAGKNETPVDPFGWGLTGTRGATIFVLGSFGAMFGVYFLYILVAHGFRQQRAIHLIFLGIPVIGPCMRAFAIARFAWAFALTQQAGMRMVPSLECSLRATANYAFIGATPRMTALIKQGEDLSTVIMDSRLFPVEFEQMVSVAETSGTVPEMLEHLSPQFEESARRSLKALATAFGWFVWALVAGFIIYAIFCLFSFYLGMINEVLKST